MGNTHVLLNLAFLLFAGVSALERGRDHNSALLQTFNENVAKNSTKFFVHTKERPGGIEFNVDEISPHIKPMMSTKILVHGYFPTENEIHHIVKEYLNSSEDNNIITFSWRFIHNMTYLAAAEATNFVGNFVLAKAIAKIGCKYTLQPQQIHLIGYHLGAHLVGKAATKLDLGIGRITGLDPSRNCYEVPCESFVFSGLRKNSAKFVDVMHTSAHIEGLSNPTGTVDLYPNGGTFQPACDHQKDMNCNSIMSLRYFAESIKFNDSFYGVQCSSHVKFLNSECKEFDTFTWSGTGSVDINTPSGSYYFETTATAPYGQGEKGINPN